MYNKIIKRVLDIVISFISIVVLLPLYLVISLSIFITMGKPIFFVQNRIGKNEKIFKMVKFRTMKPINKDNLLYGEEKKRLTKLGKILRSTSLDELPELFNVIIGNMSLIGPRPLPDYYQPFFYEDERKRHLVRGGLIPPDSLSKKIFTTWEEQFYFELNYINNVTFLMDFKILLYTFLILIKRISKKYGEEFRPHLNEYRKGNDGI